MNKKTQDLTIDEVAMNLASVSGISFDTAKSQIEAVLRAFSTPSCAAVKKMAAEGLSETLFFGMKTPVNRKNR